MNAKNFDYDVSPPQTLGKEEGRLELCKERVRKATRAACVLLREKLTSLEAPSSAVDQIKIMKFLCITYDNFQK